MIKLDESLGLGDTIEFWVKVGGRTNVTVSSLIIDAEQVDYAPAGTEAKVAVPTSVRPGDRVFKTFDHQLMEKARTFFAGASPVRRVPVDVTVQAAEGRPLSITLCDADGYIGRGETDFLAEKALKRPLDYETVAKQVGRLGTTIFSLNKLDCDLAGSLMVPISEINEARRQAVQSLTAARLSAYGRLPLDKSASLPLISSHTTERNSNKVFPEPALVVNVDTVEKAGAALGNGADVVMFGGENYQHQSFSAEDYREVVNMARQQGKAVVLQYTANF